MLPALASWVLLMTPRRLRTWALVAAVCCMLVAAVVNRHRLGWAVFYVVFSLALILQLVVPRAGEHCPEVA